MTVALALSWRASLFRRFAVSNGLSMAGDQYAQVVLPLAILSIGGAVEVGLALGARALSTTAFLLLGGAIADRVPRAAVLIAANAVKVLVQVSTVLLLLGGVSSVWPIVALQCGYGAAVAAYLPTTNGVIQHLVPRSRLASANAQVGIITSLATGGGPLLAGGLLVVASPTVALLVGVAAFVVAILLLVKVPCGRAPRSAGPGLVRDMVTSWNAFKELTWLWSGVLFLGLFQFVVMGLYYVGGPLVADERLGGPDVWGFIAAAYGCGTVAGSALTLRWRTSNPLHAFYCALVLMVPALLCLGWAAPLGWQLAAHALAGAGIAYASVLWDLSVQASAEPEYVSRISAYEWLGSTALRPLGLAIAGPVLLGLGITATFTAAAVLLMAGGGLMLVITSLMTSRPKELDVGAELSQEEVSE
uniref:MFS transporter n=1 Tax=Amycolatopsis keratiniphila TaxID=129921 RepID=UPI0009DF736A|nr:MFS transporter [Amycolatopsis keratiniphila]